MKTEDFERLKKLCDENGFKLVTESPKDNDKFFVVKKKDEWEGVEFAQCIKEPEVKKPSFYDDEQLQDGKIYKVSGVNFGYVSIFGFQIATNQKYFKPSTEQAYIDQLKKEAFERFGEIKDGDRFTELNGRKDSVRRNLNQWFYEKTRDMLFLQDLVIYCKGKWAERVKERIAIKWEECDGNYIKFSYSGSVNLIPRMNELSALLEKYLNNEI